MKDYTREELEEISTKSYGMTSCYDDSIEQYNRDRAGVILRTVIDVLQAMDSIISGTEGDYESAWKALHITMMTDVNYYLRLCESLERGEYYGQGESDHH